MITGVAMSVKNCSRVGALTVSHGKAFHWGVTLGEKLNL